MRMLEAQSLTVRYGSLAAVNGVSFALEENQWLMIVGPNGAGKSTLASALTRGVPYTGVVRILGEDILGEKPARLARKIGMLLQSNAVSYSFTVEEVVRMGRYAWSRGPLAGRSAEDDSAVERALGATGMAALRERSVLTLSGGELQRTFLAQALTQDPGILVLDEPANHLDLVYQRQVFGMISQWMREPGRAVISVVHDLSLARAFGTHALLMDGGVCAAQGPVGEALAAANLNAVYHMDVGRWMRDMLSLWGEPEALPVAEQARVEPNEQGNTATDRERDDHCGLREQA